VVIQVEYLFMRADRLLSLMLYLQTEGTLTAHELAARFAVSERTIYRDVEALSLVGIPIYAQRGANGGISLDEHYRTSLTGFSLADLRALFLTSNSGPLHDLGLTLENSILKLLAALPSRHQQEVDRLRQRFYIDSARWFDYSTRPSLLPDLQQAVWEDRQVALIYRNYEGNSSEQTIDAYALVAKANVWYLIARRPDRAYRTYRAARITALRITDHYFQRDPEFDLLAYWNTMTHTFEQTRVADYPFYPATLRLTQSAYALLSEFVPERSTILDSASGEVWIRVRVMFLSSHEALMNVLALGAHVQVIAPDALQTLVQETARAVLANQHLEISTPEIDEHNS
jgi:predicted DNA-binding transcriptional regulator YafY